MRQNTERGSRYIFDIAELRCSFESVTLVGIDFFLAPIHAPNCGSYSCFEAPSFPLPSRDSFSIDGLSCVEAELGLSA